MKTVLVKVTKKCVLFTADQYKIVLFTVGQKLNYILHSYAKLNCVKLSKNEIALFTVAQNEIVMFTLTKMKYCLQVHNNKTVLFTGAQKLNHTVYSCTQVKF